MGMVEHYGEAASEQNRLSHTGHGRLEFLRTRELVRRRLCAPARVLDIGGGTGVHARWLAADGHRVTLLDPVPAHVAAAARQPGVSALLGDARDLPVASHSADVVLLLGPLYHLLTVDDRARALAETRRVLRRGGLLFAAGISRYLSALEAGANGSLDREMEPSVRAVIADGRYDGHLGFTPTYWHTAAELRSEVAAAGLSEVTVYGVEGPVWPAIDAAAESEARLGSALRCARLTEQDPLVINSSAHLLATARNGRNVQDLAAQC